MSLDVCLPGLVAGGQVDAQRAAEIEGLYGDLTRNYRRQFGDQTAKAMASEEVLRQLGIQAAQKKRQTMLQMAAQKGALMNMKGYAGGNGTGPIDPKAATALFDHDPHARYSNVEGRRRAIKGRIHGYMDELLARHRVTLTGGARRPAELVDIVRERFGEASGNAAAKELSDAVGEAFEYARQRYNAAGGHIGKLDRFGLPQSHDSRAVRQAGYRAWRDFILPHLDRERMIDSRTGAPYSDEALELALRDVHEKIRTDGWSAVKPGSPGAGKMLANQNAEHRFLHFKSADSWLAYQDRFGAGTAFDAIMGHVEAMSRDIALLEILGPNPAATVAWLKDSLEKSGKLVEDDGSAGDAAFKGASQVQKLYDEYTGALRRPESRKIALGFSAFRSIQTAAKLGSATLSAISDLSFGAITRKFNGLPALPMLGNYLKQLNPASAADRKLAVRAGLIAEEWSHMAAAQNRYLNEELTGEWASRLASGVLRVSGLSAFTQAGRWAFGMEFLGHLTDQSVKRFADLDPAFRRTLERNGIGEDGWERIRATPLEEERGVAWLFPRNIEDRELADRVLEMILTEMDFAVPVADLRTRAMMNSVAPRGTWIGETARSMLQFKTFGISVMLTHGRRVMEMAGTNAARYAAGLFIATAIGGAVAWQLKELSKGKDPAPMDSPEFWGKAVLQGGGFGIFGDFLGATENRFGGGLATTIAGPGAQTVQNVGALTFGNAAKAIRGDKTNVGRDIVQVMRQETPGGSLWYSRLAFERLVLDQLQEQIDPDYRKSWRRMKQRADEKGQEYFWEPGEAAPQRAPDFGNLGGGE